MYIPKKWFINPENEREVYELFQEYFPCDVLTEEQVKRQMDLVRELKNIGETEIAKRFLNGEIVING